ATAPSKSAAAMLGWVGRAQCAGSPGSARSLTRKAIRVSRRSLTVSPAPRLALTLRAQVAVVLAGACQRVVTRASRVGPTDAGEALLRLLVERRRPPGLHAGVPQSGHQVPHRQPLADVALRVEVAPGIEHGQAPAHQGVGQRDVGGDTEVLRRAALEDVGVSD